jgi:filamentous hemagglutinin family protein
MPRTPSHPQHPLTQALAGWLLLLLAVAPPYLPAARAEIEGEQVVKGKASFHRDGDLTVIRPSDNAIIDYSRFDILEQETVRFEQRSEQSRVLNRVYGDATRIDGTLQANGIVYIVNPSGVFFGGNAVVDAQLIAAGGQMSNRDFLRGADVFTLTGSVVNEGRIFGEQVALLGRHVANHGRIVAPDGVIALVAGERVVLTQLDGGLSVVVDGPGALDEGGYGVVQAGRVDAGPKGSALFAVGDHYSLALNHTGITRGRTIEARGGDGGLVRVAGTLDASASWGRGGRVHVIGDRIMIDGATIDASGTWGGGQIRIGGDLGGRGPLRNARRTFISSDTYLKADALLRNDGGTIVVYSEESTGFFGRVSARGGAQRGDGGFAELSSGGALVDEGLFDLRAPNGRSGTLLYDPQDIIIVGGAGDESDNGNEPDVVRGDSGTAGTILFGDAGDGDVPFLISEQEIEGTDANIVLEARNGIRVSGTFSNDAGEGVGVLAIRTGNDLTLRTRNDTNDHTGGGTPGIDLTSSDHLENLEVRTSGDGLMDFETGTGETDGVEAAIEVGVLRTDGGDVDLATEDGSITVGSITTSGVGDGTDGTNAGDIRLDAGDEDGSGDTAVLVTGDLIARGEDGGAGRGGNGGVIAMRTRAKPLPPPQTPPVPNPPATGGGPVTVMGQIDSSGGDGMDGGGIGGQVFVEAGVQGDVSLGNITSRGGDAIDVDEVSNGGRGGQVQVITDDGDIEVGAIDARGGDSDGEQFETPPDPDDPIVPLERGGAGGSVAITAGRGSPASGPIEDPAGGILLEGSIDASGGAGPENGVGIGGRVELRAEDDIEHAGLAGTHITTQAAVIFNGTNVGADGAFQVDGGEDSEAGLLGVGAQDVARVHATRGFDDIQVASLTGDADIEVTQGTTDVVRIDQGRIEAIDSVESRANVVVALSDELTDDEDLDLNLVVETGSSLNVGGELRLVSEDDITIGDGAGTAIVMRAEPDDPENMGDPDPVTTTDVLLLVADSDNNGEGAIVDGGGMLDLVEGDANDEAGGVAATAGSGIGTAANPIRITGGSPIAFETQESGGVFVHNEDGGDLTVARVFGNAGGLDGIAVLEGPGNVGLTNSDGRIVIESSIETSGGTDFSGGDVTLDAGDDDIVLATLSGVTAVDATGDIHFASNVTLMQDSVVLSLNSGEPEDQGDITFDGTIDTDPERGDRVRVLSVVTGGVTTLRGDVGATSNLREFLTTGDVAIDGDRQIVTSNGVALGGDVYAAGVADDSASLEIVTAVGVALGGNVDGVAGEHGRLSSFTIDYNDDPTVGVELPPVHVAFVGEGDQRIVTGAGGVHIIPDGRAEVPALSTIAKTGGNLRLESDGGMVEIGPNEKLNVNGTAELVGGSVRIGDVSALELHVTSPDTVIHARQPGSVRLRGGGSAVDGGTDLIANVVSFSAAPTFAGDGPPPRIAAKTVTNPGLIETQGLSNDITLERLGGGEIPLDLAILAPDPGHETVLRGPVVEGITPLRTGDEAATGSALPPGAEETLAFLRCASEGSDDCPEATPGSPLDTPRGRDLAERSQHWLGRTDDARAARAALARLEPQALRELAVFLTEVRLLGLSDSEYVAVRDAFYGQLLAEAGPGAPAPDVLAQGVMDQSRGVPL